MIQNGIPFSAIIFEPIIAILMLTETMMLFNKSIQRRKKTTYYLTLAILFLALSITSSAIGKIINYYYLGDVNKNYAGFTIVLAYISTAIANIFTTVFIKKVFMNKSKIIIPISVVANLITIILLAKNITFDQQVYDSIFYYLVWHIFVSFVIYTILAIISFKTTRKTSLPIPRLGFKFITWFGIFVDLTFVFFILDLAFGLNKDGYTIFYYMGWISALFAAIFAYFGYIMPKWLSNIFIKS